MSMHKLQYVLWHMLECLITGFGAAAVLPSFVLFFIWVLCTWPVIELLRKLNLSQLDIGQWFEQSWRYQGGLLVVQPFIEVVIIARWSCQRRSLQLRVRSEEPVSTNGLPLIHDYVPTDQSSSMLFTKLPQELREEIYKQYILLDGPGLCPEVSWRPEGRHFVAVLHAAPYAFGSSRPQVCNTCKIKRHKRHCSALNHVRLTKQDRGRGKLAMLKSCKLVYKEMIPLLYRLPIFCFDKLMLQPFFLRNVPLHHLRNITQIQLGYDEKTVCCALFASVHVSEHCAPCNMERWLTTIRKELTGLQKIDVFLYLDLARGRRPDDPRRHVRLPWFYRFLALQHSPRGMRELQVHVRLCPDLREEGQRENIEKLFRWGVEYDRRTKCSLLKLPTLPRTCQLRAYETQA